MGVIFSKFRKAKTTAVILEGLEEKIQQIEKYTINTQERKKRFVSNFLGISIGIYVIVFVLLYFFYFPPTWKERIVYLVPLMLFPIVINLLRQMFTWYFQRKLNKNSVKLNELREQKSKILEQVMDKETYKVALNLLERFGDKKPTRLSLGTTTTRVQPNTTVANNTPNRSVHMRGSGAANTSLYTPRTNAMPYQSVYRSMQQQQQQQLTPHRQTLQQQLATTTNSELRRRTPFPIVDMNNRTVVERIIDAIVGESPHDRFALICKECNKHNGMIPQDDYEYITFHCAFCGAVNPARKARPVAPRLTLNPNSPVRRPSDTASEGQSSSDDDEDDNNAELRRAATEHLELTELTEQSEMTENVLPSTNGNVSDEVVADDITKLLNDVEPTTDDVAVTSNVANEVASDIS